MIPVDGRCGGRHLHTKHRRTWKLVENGLCKVTQHPRREHGQHKEHRVGHPSRLAKRFLGHKQAPLAGACSSTRGQPCAGRRDDKHWCASGQGMQEAGASTTMCVRCNESLLKLYAVSKLAGNATCSWACESRARCAHPSLPSSSPARRTVPLLAHQTPTPLRSSAALLGGLSSASSSLSSA